MSAPPDATMGIPGTSFLAAARTGFDPANLEVAVRPARLAARERSR